MNLIKYRHYISFFILSLNYLFPLIIFGKITLFYIDSLDNEIVFNSVLGKIYAGQTEAIDSFLGGTIAANYLRRIFQPFSLFYFFFNAELAYWIIDVLVKITSYFSFYLLAKKINKNLFFCSLGAAIYASINLPTHEGFYFAIFPYTIYLIFFKNNISTKHFLILFFFGLNSDILRSPFFIPVILVLSILFKDKNKNYFKNFVKVSIIFLSAILISNINIIYVALFDGPFHRHEWIKEALPIKYLFQNVLFGLIDINHSSSKYKLALAVPITILKISLIIFSIILLKKKRIFQTLIILFSISLFVSVIKLEFFLKFIESNSLKIYNFGYLGHYYILFFALLFIFITRENYSKKKYLTFLSVFSLLLMQINSSIGPIYKKYFIENNNNFRNFYTFEGYYLPSDYKKIKNIVKDKRTISIGLDPMVAVMNDIKTIDGYHNLYPLDYKKKFRKVIEGELKQNDFWRNYFDNYGSRLYAIINRPDELKINFTEAKKLGAEYVISKYLLKSEKLTSICENCENNDFFIYQIN